MAARVPSILHVGRQIVNTSHSSVTAIFCRRYIQWKKDNLLFKQKTSETL